MDPSYLFPHPLQTLSQSGLRCPQPHLQSAWSSRRDFGGISVIVECVCWFLNHCCLSVSTLFLFRCFLVDPCLHFEFLPEDFVDDRDR